MLNPDLSWEPSLLNVRKAVLSDIVISARLSWFPEIVSIMEDPESSRISRKSPELCVWVSKLLNCIVRVWNISSHARRSKIFSLKDKVYSHDSGTRSCRPDCSCMKHSMDHQGAPTLISINTPLKIQNWPKIGPQVLQDYRRSPQNHKGLYEGVRI